MKVLLAFGLSSVLVSVQADDPTGEENKLPSLSQILENTDRDKSYHVIFQLQILDSQEVSFSSPPPRADAALIAMVFNCAITAPNSTEIDDRGMGRFRSANVQARCGLW